MMKIHLLFLSGLFFSFAGYTQAITTNPISGSPFCVTASSGASVTVAFTSTGTFNPGNIYTAQLSDGAGSFAIPVSIGNIYNFSNSGSITANIPAGTSSGTGFRIRVISSNPIVAGSNNGTNLVIQKPIADAGPDQSFNCGNSYTLGGITPGSGSTGPYTYNWTSPVLPNPPNVPNPVVMPGNNSVYSLNVTDFYGCTSVADFATLSPGTTGVTNLWTGIGTGGTGTDFNDPANWSLGRVPLPCDNATINYHFNLVGALNTIQITAPVSLHNFVINSDNGNSTDKKLVIDAGNNTFVMNSLRMRTSGGTGKNVTELVSSGSVIVQGLAIIDDLAANNRYSGIGGNGSGTPTFTFYFNVTFNAFGFTDSINPPNVNFYGTNQILNYNNAVGLYTNFKNVQIGNGIATTQLTLAGAGSATGTRGVEGDLTVNAGSTLSLPVSTTFNQQIPNSGKLSLAASSSLVLYDKTGGVPNSNFPKNFLLYGDGAGSIMGFQTTSNVEYALVTLENQNIFPVPEYGNLIVSGAGGKTADGPLTIKGNLLIKMGARFNSNGITGWTHNIGGNWVNNGIFGYAPGTTNTINFYGNNDASIGGTSLSDFHTVTVNKGSNINTILNVTSIITTRSLQGITGLLRVPAGGSVTATTSGPNVLSAAGLHINGGVFNTTGVPLNSAGLFLFTSGTASIGTALGNSFNMNSGGTFVMTNGILNVAGRLTFSTGATPLSYLTGGTINLSSVGQSSNISTLDMTGPTKMNISGGLITFRNANGGSGGDINILFTTGAKNFTGGTLQFGTSTTPLAQIFKIKSEASVYDVTVYNNNNPVAQLTNNILGSHNITILSGGTLDAATNDKDINISGNWINDGLFNSGAYPSKNTTVNFNGSSLQTISGLAAKTTFNNLKLSNSAGLTLSQNVDLLNAFSFGVSGATLTTGGLLTVKSSATNTGQIADVTGNTINGNVTVERYIATGTTGSPNHGKSWQLLAVPTTGQTIKDAWQEGASQTNVPPPGGTGNNIAGSLGNPVAGYGTMLTSNVAGATLQPNPGFDAYTSPGPSIKVFNSATSGYDGPPNSNTTPIYNQKGYFVFVRGDRSVYAFNQAANPTILRTKGTLFTPANLPPGTTVAANSFESIGNPYASAIDFRSITKSNVSDVFQVWDPRLGGGYNYGGFQTFTKNTTTGNYEVTPGGGSYGIYGSVNNLIQSGQAFIVQTTGLSGSVGFTETCKAGGSILFTTPNRAPTVQQTLRTNLYSFSADGNTELIDGVLNDFDNTFSNALDGQDAMKPANTGENFGIRKYLKLLVVERSQIPTAQDTIFLNLTGVRVQAYRFELTAANLNTGSLQGFFEDNYLHTKTPLNMNGTTMVDFTIVNIAGSYASDRFRIVFTSTPAVVLPVTFTSVKAYRQAANINVEWKVENEMNIKNYDVEKSIDGIHFTTLVTKAATANGGRLASYQVADVQPVNGYNYYRIRSNDLDGKTKNTQVVKVFMGSMKQDIVIYPNPITDGMIHLQLMNQPEGKYRIRLLNKLGQVIMTRQVTRMDGSSTELIKWDFNLAHGIYQLEVTKPDGSKKDINVMY